MCEEEEEEEEEEEREWLWEEREREVRLVLLEKESVGVDGFCFGEILQWVARDEHKESVTEAIVAICSLLSQSSQLWFFCVSLFSSLRWEAAGLSYSYPFLRE